MRYAIIAIVLSMTGFGCEGQIGGGGDPTNPSDPSFDPDRLPPVGPRSARRLSAGQLRASLVAATGFDYTGRARVSDPSAPQGSEIRDDVPLLEAYGATLGDPDYNYVTQVSLDPTITFSKLAGDGVRAVCAAAAEAEVVGGSHPLGPHLLSAVDGTESLAEDEPAIRANITRLALRFWGHRQATDDVETSALLPVYEAGYGAWEPAEPDPDDPDPEEPVAPARARSASAWNAVCVAMLSDPRFLTY